MSVSCGHSLGDNTLSIELVIRFEPNSRSVTDISRRRVCSIITLILTTPLGPGLSPSTTIYSCNTFPLLSRNVTVT
jgi:hypothetical protein